MGTSDVEVPPLNRPTLDYARAVEALPALDTQGDGIKSFLGLVLTVVAGTSQILLVDEPEAFLHPAQARALGRWLSVEAVKRDIQIFLASHDRDLLLGLLDGGQEAVVNIVRLTRTGDANNLHNLQPEEVAAVWNDPVLRYSNILQGLFHRRVVICESDADCRFYGAVLDNMSIEDDKQSMADSVLLVPSGGKQRIAGMAAALTRLGVDTHAIVDFDVLSKRNDVKGIVAGMGATWSPTMNAAYVAMADVANQGQLWSQLKNQGLNGLPAGAAYTACEQLLAELAGVGVHIVPGGELEDFNKSIALDGAAWVSQMLEANGHKTNEAARNFVRPLLL